MANQTIGSVSDVINIFSYSRPIRKRDDLIPFFPSSQFLSPIEPMEGSQGLTRELRQRKEAIIIKDMTNTALSFDIPKIFVNGKDDWFPIESPRNSSNPSTAARFLQPINLPGKTESLSEVRPIKNAPPFLLKHQRKESIVVYPERSKSDFDENITSSLKFDSNFECGNLAAAERIISSIDKGFESTDITSENDGAIQDEYELYLKQDIEINPKHNEYWFFFRIKTPENPKNTFVKTTDKKKYYDQREDLLLNQKEETNQKRIRYKFSIQNYNNHRDKIYAGYRPVYLSVHDYTKEGIGWRSFGDDISLNVMPPPQPRGHDVSDSTAAILLQNKIKQQSYCLSFSFVLNNPEDVLYIAYAQPYSFYRLQSFVYSLLNDKSKSPHLKVEELCRTPFGNRVDLLTITDQADPMLYPVTKQTQESPASSTRVSVVSDVSTTTLNVVGATRSHSQDGSAIAAERQSVSDSHDSVGATDTVLSIENAGDGDGETGDIPWAPSRWHEPAYIKNLKRLIEKRDEEKAELEEKMKGRERRKKAVMVVARSHPGDTSSSWQCEGLIDFLLSDHPKAESLRSSFVFFIVPMPSPDGVVAGSSIMDTCGEDIACSWAKVKPDKLPAILEIRKIMRTLGSNDIFSAFIELQGGRSSVASKGSRQEDLSRQDYVTGLSLFGWVREQAKLENDVFIKRQSSISFVAARKKSKRPSLFKSSSILVAEKDTAESSILERRMAARKESLTLHSKSGRVLSPRKSSIFRNSGNAVGKQNLPLSKGLSSGHSLKSIHSDSVMSLESMSEAAEESVDRSATQKKLFDFLGDEEDDDDELFGDSSVFVTDPSMLAIAMNEYTSLMNIQNCRFGMFRSGEVRSEETNLLSSDQLSYVVAGMDMHATLSFCVQMSDIGGSKGQYANLQLGSKEFSRAGLILGKALCDIFFPSLREKERQLNRRAGFSKPHADTDLIDYENLHPEILKMLSTEKRSTSSKSSTSGYKLTSVLNMQKKMMSEAHGLEELENEDDSGEESGEDLNDAGDRRRLEVLWSQPWEGLEGDSDQDDSMDSDDSEGLDATESDQYGNGVMLKSSRLITATDSLSHEIPEAGGNRDGEEEYDQRAYPDEIATRALHLAEAKQQDMKRLGNSHKLHHYESKTESYLERFGSGVGERSSDHVTSVRIVKRRKWIAPLEGYGLRAVARDKTGRIDRQALGTHKNLPMKLAQLLFFDDVMETSVGNRANMRDHVADMDTYEDDLKISDAQISRVIQELEARAPEEFTELVNYSESETAIEDTGNKEEENSISNDIRISYEDAMGGTRFILRPLAKRLYLSMAAVRNQHAYEPDLTVSGTDPNIPEEINTAANVDYTIGAGPNRFWRAIHLDARVQVTGATSGKSSLILGGSFGIPAGTSTGILDRYDSSKTLKFVDNIGVKKPAISQDESIMEDEGVTSSSTAVSSESQLVEEPTRNDREKDVDEPLSEMLERESGGSTPVPVEVCPDSDGFPMGELADNQFEFPVASVTSNFPHTNAEPHPSNDVQMMSEPAPSSPVHLVMDVNQNFMVDNPPSLQRNMIVVEQTIVAEELLSQRSSESSIERASEIQPLGGGDMDSGSFHLESSNESSDKSIVLQGETKELVDKEIIPKTPRKTMSRIKASRNPPVVFDERMNNVALPQKGNGYSSLSLGEEEEDDRDRDEREGITNVPDQKQFQYIVQFKYDSNTRETIEEQVVVASSPNGVSFAHSAFDLQSEDSLSVSSANPRKSKRRHRQKHKASAKPSPRFDRSVPLYIQGKSDERAKKFALDNPVKSEKDKIQELVKAKHHRDPSGQTGATVAMPVSAPEKISVDAYVHKVVVSFPKFGGIKSDDNKEAKQGNVTNESARRVETATYGLSRVAGKVYKVPIDQNPASDNRSDRMIMPKPPQVPLPSRASGRNRLTSWNKNQINDEQVQGPSAGSTDLVVQVQGIRQDLDCGTNAVAPPADKKVESLSLSRALAGALGIVTSLEDRPETETPSIPMHLPNQRGRKFSLTGKPIQTTHVRETEKLGPDLSLSIMPTSGLPTSVGKRGSRELGQHQNKEEFDDHRLQFHLIQRDIRHAMKRINEKLNQRLENTKKPP